jgi:endonuclease/exonuclease/phosphatase family metal-dependent hydrolase
VLPRILVIAPLIAACAPEAPEGPAPLSLVAMTFNSGTSEGMPHDAAPDDGYGEAQALLSDEFYGDGLAWQRAVDDARAFFDEVRPDVVGFQEIFHSDECAQIPAEGRPGFVCETWQAGDPTVANVILGEDYQVACHQAYSDKCLAVRRAFGTIRGCDGDLCLDGLDGKRVETCGSGSRVGRATIDLAEGGELTVVNVHGSSGLTTEDQLCREKQFETVFDDLDGEPAINGARNLILGDFNTDPGRWYFSDPSALIIAERVSETGLRFHSDVGEDAEPTYLGVANIDHVISDAFEGGCWVGGLTPGKPSVTDMVYFDHLPVVCELSE